MAAAATYCITPKDLSTLLNTELELLQQELQKPNAESVEGCRLTASFFERLLPTLNVEFSSLPESMKNNQKQIFALKAVKAMFCSLNTFDSDCKDQLRRNIVEMFAKSSLESLVSTPEFFEPWIEEMIACRKLFEQHLPPASFESGSSKGILYKIKKEGMTFGYLLGTAHHLLASEQQEAAKLSAHIYNKLCKCILIGTETKLVPKKLKRESVEKKLFEVAKTQGIVNFGIDAPERDRLEAIYSSSEDEDCTEEEYQKALAQTNTAIGLYQAGDAMALEALIKQTHAEESCTPEEEQIEQLRNCAIANNIHALLEASARAANKLGEARIPRSFFAIGTYHLLLNTSTYESVPAKLTKLGWDLLITAS